MATIDQLFTQIRASLRRLFDTQGNHENRIRDLERNLRAAGWRFNILNEGGWGFVRANASSDEGYGVLGLAFIDASGDGLAVLSQDIGNTKQGLVSATPDLVRLALSSSLSCVLDRTTGTFTLYDGAGNPMLRMTAGSPNLHIPTGGSVIADL